jgi:MoaA/NifB/PqqE/SkfB family radical SAM enzyme
MNVPEIIDNLELELTNACGYSCFCCPREQLTRDIGVMSTEQLALMCERLQPLQLKAIWVCGFGEPLLHPELVECVALLRQSFPAASINMVSTLGIKGEPGFWQRLADAGLDLIRVSLYGYTAGSYSVVHGADRFVDVMHNLRLLADSGIRIRIKVPAFGEDSPLSGELASYEPAAMEKVLSELNSLGINARETAHLFNRGTGREFNKPGCGFPCSIAWGGEQRFIRVWQDLSVVPCCMYFDGEYSFGNLGNQSLEEIYSSEAYTSFIKSTLEDDLSGLPTCANCERNYQGTAAELARMEFILGRRQEHSIDDTMRFEADRTLEQAERVAEAWQRCTQLYGACALFGAGRFSSWLLDIIEIRKLPEPAAVLDDAAEAIRGRKVVRPEQFDVAAVGCVVPGSDVHVKTMRKRLENMWGGLVALSALCDDNENGCMKW